MLKWTIRLLVGTLDDCSLRTSAPGRRQALRINRRNAHRSEDCLFRWAILQRALAVAAASTGFFAQRKWGRNRHTISLNSAGAVYP